MSETNGWELRHHADLGTSVYNRTGQEIAFFSAHETGEVALKRAELFYSAPEMFDALCDIIEICDRELPAHLKETLAQSRGLIQKLRR